MKVELKIKEDKIVSPYTQVNVLKIGELIIAKYGYNYSSSKDESKAYCAYSELPFIKKDRWLFETSEGAREFAYEIAKTVIKLISEHIYED